MMRRMDTFAALLVTAAWLAGCATEEPRPAPAAPAVAGAPQKPAAAAASPAPKPVAPSAAARSAARSAQADDALNDPQSMLAKRSVYYDFDRYEVKPEFQALIEAHAKYLREHPASAVKIEGNADERGSREYNVALGQRRSESVMKMLLLLGVGARQMEAVSYGEERPKAAGHDEAAWSQNRRSDIVYERAK